MRLEFLVANDFSAKKVIPKLQTTKMSTSRTVTGHKRRRELPELLEPTDTELSANLSVLRNKRLELRESPIPGANLGLFARVPIKRGEPITEYYGQIIDSREAKRRKEQNAHSHIVPLVNFRWYIDGKHRIDGREILDPRMLNGRGIGAFVNSCRGTEFAENARFDFKDDSATAHILRRDPCDTARVNPLRRFKYVRAVRDIPAGEEILVDYNFA